MRYAEVGSLVVLVLVAANVGAFAAYIPVYGGPTYDAATGTGITNSMGIAVNDAGAAVGWGDKYANSTGLGLRAIRWDGSGAPAQELGNLGTGTSGITYCQAYAINDAGTAVGYADKYAGLGSGSRAVLWSSSGTTAAELGYLGKPRSGGVYCAAYAINNAGTAVGYANTSVASGYEGTAAVRWNASGTPTELGHISKDHWGLFDCEAQAVNDAGTAVGYGAVYVGLGRVGDQALRWDATGTEATELGNLGSTPDGSTTVYATAINSAGTAVGYGKKYVGGVGMGWRAIRWDATGTAATELGTLGLGSSGSPDCEAVAINARGTAVGYGVKSVGGDTVGYRAIRWDPSGTDATELGSLGTEVLGLSQSFATAINGSGIAVGYSYFLGDSRDLGYHYHAVYWDLDGTAVDLNDLIDPSSGWDLWYAYAISDTGWVTGYGMFDPDGSGPVTHYQRAFLMQLPEPGTLSLLALGGLWALRRRARP